MNARICLGAFAGAHGVKGAAKVRTFTQTEHGVAEYGPVELENRTRRFTLAFIRVLKPGLAIVTAPEIKSREDAAALSGERFYVDRAALPATDADEFYMEDLVGLAVVDDQSATLGRIVGVHNFGAGDILEIGERPGGAGTLFAPFTRTAFPAVDLRRRVVVAVLAAIQGDDGDGEEAALVTESMRQEDA